MDADSTPKHKIKHDAPEEQSRVSRRLEGLLELAGAFPEMEMSARCQDRLDELFQMQTKLNDLAFEKNGLVDRTGKQLTMACVIEDAVSNMNNGGTCQVNSLTNEWLTRYTQALGKEVEEIAEALPWKFWSKSKTDLAHVREEIIDALHFWISLALVSGMDSGDVMDEYSRKYRTNMERQQTNYTARGDLS